MTSDVQDVLVPALQQDVAYLVGEGLVAAAGQRNAKAARSGATSIRQAGRKVAL